MNPLLAISPIDGRYSDKTQALQTIFSEFGLIKSRLIVEVEFFKALAANASIAELPNLSPDQMSFIDDLIADFDIEQCQKVKDIERTTNHDVKALEYYIKQQLSNCKGLQQYGQFIHFACTSEDINNLAHALMLQQGREVLLKQWQLVKVAMEDLITTTADIAMIGRTHGQPATPTTMGKEMANFYVRMNEVIARIGSVAIKGKLNGAIGNFNPHLVAYPNVDWPKFAEQFIASLGLSYTSHSTQIESHDYIAQMCSELSNFCTIIIDLDRDIWSYISQGYFRQKIVEGEVGSSTMPHKVNPIDFENSEGNAQLASAMSLHLAQVLPISRLQRDLTDSTTLRNIGVGFAYALIALKSLHKGLAKLQIDRERIRKDLDNSWELLAEPIQTIMRKHRVDNAYEKLKQLTRGKSITERDIQQFVDSLTIPDDDKQALKQLNPSCYTGVAQQLADEAIHRWRS